MKPSAEARSRSIRGPPRRGVFRATSWWKSPVARTAGRAIHACCVRVPQGVFEEAARARSLATDVRRPKTNGGVPCRVAMVAMVHDARSVEMQDNYGRPGNHEKFRRDKTQAQAGDPRHSSSMAARLRGHSATRRRGATRCHGSSRPRRRACRWRSSWWACASSTGMRTESRRERKACLAQQGGDAAASRCAGRCSPTTVAWQARPESTHRRCTLLEKSAASDQPRRQVLLARGMLATDTNPARARSGARAVVLERSDARTSTPIRRHSKSAPRRRPCRAISPRRRGIRSTAMSKAKELSGIPAPQRERLDDYVAAANRGLVICSRSESEPTRTGRRFANASKSWTCCAAWRCSACFS